jgi:hypothetical protein
MALLANVLAIAFAGLFYRETILLAKPALFTPPLERRFVSINGSSGPPIDKDPFRDTTDYSGAYQGGLGEDHFLALESNLTRKTALPSWTDDKAMYLPFTESRPTVSGQIALQESHTLYVGAAPNCTPSLFDKDYHLVFWNEDLDRQAPHQIFDVQVLDAAGQKITCYATGGSLGRALGRMSRIPYENVCREGKTAAELVTTLTAGPNATALEEATCTVSVRAMRAIVFDHPSSHQYNSTP